MASFQSDYRLYPLEQQADGSYIIVDGAGFDSPPFILQSSGGSGPGVFNLGDQLLERTGSPAEFYGPEYYYGSTIDGIVTVNDNGLLRLYSFREDSDLQLGTEVEIARTSLAVCFLAGTKIATPAGETPVESLAVGDLVLTADGRAAPVRWVGVQTVVTLFADPLRSFPIRITAGALGQNLPVRDLLVSPDHALMLDGVLVQAGALVNGTTIVRETAMPERFTYFHVELDDHSLILAEGVPAETFLDTVTRRRFDNWADYESRYGDTGPVLTEFPAPRIKSARQLPLALRERLAATATVADAA